MMFRVPSSACRVVPCLFLLPGTVSSQARQPVQGTIEWWQGAATAGAILFSGFFDEAVQHSTQDSRTPEKDQLAAFFRHMGQPEVFATIPIAMFLGGTIGRNLPLRNSAERIAVSLALAAVVTTTTKYVVGRERPFAAEEPNVFHPFSGADAFPSGHTTMAFGLAAALSDEIHTRGPAPACLRSRRAPAGHA